MNNSAPRKTVDAFFNDLSEKQRLALQHLRQIIKAAAPKAEEIISYGMPAYKYHGQLCYFNAYDNHYSLYAVNKESFAEELKGYKTSKGTIQIPYDKPLPDDLVRRLVAFRMKENEAKYELTKFKKTRLKK